MALACGGPGWSAASSQASQVSGPSPAVKAMVKAFDPTPVFVDSVPPPPAGPPPSLEECMFGPDHGDNKWGGAVLALPSQVLGGRPSQPAVAASHRGGDFQAAYAVGPQRAADKTKAQPKDPHAAIDLVKNPPGVSSTQPWPKGPPPDPRNSMEFAQQALAQARLERRVDQAEWSMVAEGGDEEGGDASKDAAVSSTPDSDAEVDMLVERAFAKEQYHQFCDQQEELLRHASAPQERQ